MIFSQAVDNALPDNSTEYEKKLSEILIISQTMLDHAKRGEWPELTQIEDRRRTLLEDFFSQTITPDMASSIEEVIRQVMTMDKEVISLGEDTQKQMASDLRDIGKGKVASKAYTDTEKGR